ncbi:MBL fold metallo-hydrolase [Ideonella azotifigens]|uniref:MBL fold metallo-hydrolase n=2 Tax=Ideonella azotifigens TaxID=513160 RepID=UPI001E413FC0|nr:MBL fold metallo-hydrolase [Ideonella azotifigens]MCD2343856.1 MBL fold metallo-hydrolase [Ideonella azotifigens]
MSKSASPVVQAFFDPATATVSYVVHDPATRRAAVVDPVLDFDAKSGRTGTHSAQALVDWVQAQALQVDWILETHAHADHLSAAPWVRAQVGGRIAIGAAIRRVQAAFAPLFNLGPDFHPDGRDFDHLFEDDEVFAVGELTARALAVPGHTPADIAFQIGDAVFVGDTLFMPDVGTARADFPGGDATQLYRSIQRLLALPAETRLFVCHDYPPAGREPRWQTNVAEQRAHNLHVGGGRSEAEFVALRQARDATLEVPVLILPSLQVNIRAGQLPAPAANGLRYLQLPLDALGG